MLQKPKKSRYSKFKDWCASKGIPVFALPLSVFVLVAVVFVILFGILSGWNFYEILTSSTAMLVYFITILAATIGVTFYIWNRTRK